MWRVVWSIQSAWWMGGMVVDGVETCIDFLLVVRVVWRKLWQSMAALDAWKQIV